jgi:hypothetical protein
MKTTAALLVSALGLAATPTVLGQGATGNKHFVKTDLMTGYQETVSAPTAPATPPAGPGTISSTGMGQFVAEIDEDAMTITYELTYSGLEGGASLFAHIHFGQRSVNGGVSAFLCGGGDKPPCPPVEGTITGVIDPTDVIGPALQGIEAGSFAELVRAMRSGVTYVNVHTTRWPAGEIRGQINDMNERQVR